MAYFTLVTLKVMSELMNIITEIYYSILLTMFTVVFLALWAPCVYEIGDDSYGGGTT